MSRWFRYYSDALNDRRIQSLPDAMFRAWVNLLCLASQSDGKINSAEDVAFALRLTEAKAREAVAFLAGRGLLDRVEGRYFEPHNWSKRQYKSDVSNERVKQHRERHRNVACNVTSAVTETVTETPPDNRTESETEQKADSCARASALRVEIVKAFEEVGRPPPDTGKAEIWIAQGRNPEICLAVIRDGLEKKPNIRALSYFEGAIADAHSAPQTNGNYHGQPQRRSTVQSDARSLEVEFRRAAESC